GSADPGLSGPASLCVFAHWLSVFGACLREGSVADWDHDSHPGCPQRDPQGMNIVTDYVNHWINNASVKGKSDRTAPVYNPATGAVTKEVRLGSVEDVNAAVAAAKAAQRAWAETSLAKRQAIMFNYRNLLVERREDLAAILTSEHGKVFSDALGEIARGIEVVEYMTAASELLKGEYSENASTGVDVYTSREPVGVVGIITPFNFPAMVPLWFFPVAIAAGNTVVLKPSEKDPSAANFLAELFAEAG